MKLPYNGIEMDQLPPQYLSLGNALLNQVPNPFYGYITSSACGLNNPTIPYGQLLRPYPEFCGVNNVQAIGASSWYDAVQFQFNHRWSHGLQFGASFTISKYLDTSIGNSVIGTFGDSNIRNYYDLAAEKGLDINDIPKSLVLNFVYELPFGSGKSFGANISRPLNAVLGGWQISGIATFKDGFPLSITAVNNNTGSFGGGQRPNLVGDPHLSNPTISEWFNTSAFAQPAAYTFGNVGKTMPNLRGPGLNNWDLGIQKWWTMLGEKLRLQFRAELFNAFNHPNFESPNTSFGSLGFGTITSALAPRDVQMAVKIYW
ncbi:MAG: hypothetical protein WAM39_14525 [Bryobacteraceae bacterium]